MRLLLFEVSPWIRTCYKTRKNLFNRLDVQTREKSNHRHSDEHTLHESVEMSDDWEDVPSNLFLVDHLVTTWVMETTRANNTTTATVPPASKFNRNP